MRVLGVNVRSGGSRGTAGALVDRCLSHEAEVLVFSEFRDNATGAYLRRSLGKHGYAHQAATEGHRGNGVLIASTREFSAIANPFGLPDDEYPNAVIEARFESVRVFGVYLPGQDRKRPHLRCLIATAARYNEGGVDAICIGDFNSGRNETDVEINLGRKTLKDEFSTADLYAELERYWTEAWLHFHPDRREFSWYPFRKAPPEQRRNGWRIDKAFVSQSLLPKLTGAQYDHGFRLEGLTDHSGLIVDLDD
ncbi:MAG TPA: endonuclease/exonuclease/phosphatase family protein [Candidatus Baltobacteraceae bacterium]|jgi:exonuclease III